MSVAKAFAARTITFLLDGLQGPTNREAREILERELADAELRREKEVRETEERRSSEVTGLGQQLAEVVAQRDEARKCFADAFARALDVKRILGAVPPEGSVSAAKRVVAERGEARGQLNEVRERAEAAEARLAALTAPVDGEPSEEALGLVWRQSVDARAESKDPFGGSQHQHRLALWRAGAAHERVRTAQLRAEVSEARADRDKAIAELEATKAIADACDQESLARAGGYLFRYVQEETVLRDCGQRRVCRTPPGCARHWEERNRELVRENEVLRSNSDHLSSENASLARQVESMAMRIESLAEELAKPEDVRLREVLDALDGRAVIFDGLGARVGHLLDEMDEWIGRAGEAERTVEAARRSLASIAGALTEHAYQELASALEAPPRVADRTADFDPPGHDHTAGDALGLRRDR